MKLRKVLVTALPEKRKSGRKHFSGYSGGLNGSTQHFLGVYSQESENLKFVVALI